MSDDSWRGKRGDDDEFGPPLFADADDPTDASTSGKAGDSDKLLFDDSSGPLPHWTEPPTGEMPRVLGGADESREDLDVWSSFSGKAPVWSDDDSLDPSSGYDAPTGRGNTGQTERYYESTDRDPSGGSGAVRREPGRITIGTDPTDEGMGRPTPNRGRTRTTREEQARAAARTGTRTPSGSVRTTPGGPRPGSGVSGRDMPTAVAVGAALAVVFILAVKWRPQAVLVIVVIVVALAAVEYFEKVTEKGYQPASVVGIVACICCPLVGYFYGDQFVPLVLVFAFIAGCATFIGAPNLNSSPMPNMAITTLGVTWIGLCGAYGGLILRLEVAPGAPTSHIGTDTLLLLAIGVVVNDVGALFVGSAAGRTPLRGWISPNKSVEGFIGGAVLTIISMIIVGIADKSDNWNNPNLIFLGIIIAIAAPLGDLTESMFKRNLDIKDFGSIVKGHGGVLDRFDGFLFTLPAVYYLTLVLQPWQAVTG